MTAAILSIGTELTRGELVNGNARWLAEQLTELGFQVVEHATVADDAVHIVLSLQRLAAQARVVVCTGGLGPTSDDLTSAAAAQALGVPLERDPASLAAIEARYRTWKRVMPAINAKQADFPRGASVLPNAVGTAPGFAVTLGGARVFFLPGVPSEMQHLYETHVAAAIAVLTTRRSFQVHIRTYGLGESALAERLRDIDLGGARHTPGITIGYRASFPEVEVKVLAEHPQLSQARELAERVAAEVRSLLSDIAYGGKDDNYPAYVGGLLKRAGLRVALAESCTGGFIAKLLTDVAGSSEYVLGGAITYANSAKHRVLGVEKQVLREHGAVSEEVARAMAEGVLRLAGAEIAVAVTGIAGPGGGSEQKPVGTVCFALAVVTGAGAQTRSRTEYFPGDREQVRVRTAYMALRLLAQAAQETLDARESGHVEQERAS
ncbi:MAG TPA: competence/damage-inducible protein A [Polyangiales bacterium]